MNTTGDSLSRWKGKTAIVTGASSGIGEAAAKSLAGLGLKVALVARREQRLAKLADQIAERGGEAHSVAGDLTDLSFCRKLFDRVEDRWGAAHLLVNNAGTHGGKGVLADDWDQIALCLDLNVKSALFCLREAVHRMQANKIDDGAVVTISSLQGHRSTSPSSMVYSASKHALRVLVNGARLDLAQQGSPIKIAMISPGMVDTEWHQDKDGEAHYDFPPLQPDDIVDAILYILSTPPNVQVSDLLLRPTRQSV